MTYYLLEDSDYLDAFVECVKYSYIQGVSFWYDGNGKAHIENFNPRITRSGLDFIEYTPD